MLDKQWCDMLLFFFFFTILIKFFFLSIIQNLYIINHKNARILEYKVR